MNLQVAEVKTLAAPQSMTAAGFTGAWIDLQGLINIGGRALKAVIMASAGGTGSATGLVQYAQDTSGTGAATLTSFTAAGTAADVTEEKHAVVPAGNRYVRFLCTIGAGTARVVSCFVVGEARVSP